MNSTSNQSLQHIHQVPDRRAQIDLLKGLKLHLQTLTNEQMRLKLVMEQQTSKLVFHRKQASNISFDVSSVSQATTASTLEKRKFEMFEQIRDNYKTVIQEKERDLIRLKKERYLYADALEDNQFELIRLRKYHQLMVKELQSLDETSRKMLSTIEKSKQSSFTRFFAAENRFGLSSFKGLLSSKSGGRPFDESLSSHRAMISENDVVQS